VGGEVGRSLLLSLSDIWRLPNRLVTSRLVDEAGRHRLAAWEGVHLSTLALLAEASPDARFVHVHCADGHRDCYTRADLMRPRAMFATLREDLALGAAMGGPLRLVLPCRHSHRSVVGIERVEFQRAPLEGVDPLRGRLDLTLDRPGRGHHGGAGDAWSAETREIEIPLQRPVDPEEGPWSALRSPWRPPDQERSEDYAQGLAQTSFEIANNCRTNLVLLGATALSALDPAKDWSPLTCPLRAPQVDTRLIAHSVLAEVDDPRSNAWSVEGLEDPSPRVSAMALDTLTRREHREALEWALSLVVHPDDGLALTAIGAAGALAAADDEDAKERLHWVRTGTEDPTRVEEFKRALAQWGGS
jgi:DMSO/TMAO reductase YedYZ molybdopterin-dependent catalytic subunit